MPETTYVGSMRLNCIKLARSLGATVGSDLPSSLQLAESASCWVGPDAPALIRLSSCRPASDSPSSPLLWIQTSDVEAAPSSTPRSAPVLSTPLCSSEALVRVRQLIDAGLDLTRPGTLIQVYGYGVFLQGESGVGKSETALELIERGHQLVADDAVRIQADREGVLLGSAQGPLRGHLAVHGLGLVKVSQLFGQTACATHAAIRMIVALTEKPKAADPLQGTWTSHGWLGRTLPRVSLYRLRPRALLIETAVRQIQARHAHGELSIPSAGEQTRELS